MVRIFVILLLLYFLTRSKTTFAQVPDSVNRAFDVMRNSEYSALVEYWKSVSKMETDNFRSEVYKTQNNLVGMKYVKTSLGYPSNKNAFASYHSLQKSVEDLIRYLRAKNYPYNFSSLKDMIRFMGDLGYYGEESMDSYYQKVISMNKRMLDIDLNKNTKQSIDKIKQDFIDPYLNEIKSYFK